TPAGGASMSRSSAVEEGPQAAKNTARPPITRAEGRGRRLAIFIVELLSSAHERTVARPWSNRRAAPSPRNSKVWVRVTRARGPQRRDRASAQSVIGVTGQGGER